MADKLQNAHIHVVIFGQISSGKSALINALVGKSVASVHPRGGTTTEVWDLDWETTPYTVPGFASSKMYLVDTPGINEVQGEEHTRLAREAAQRADLILFVTDKDLTDPEFAAITDLATSKKPMILVFNKTDLYNQEDRSVIHRVLQDRVRTIVAPDNVVQIAANPLEREVIIERPDGRRMSSSASRNHKSRR
jgi:GTPase